MDAQIRVYEDKPLNIENIQALHCPVCNKVIIEFGGDASILTRCKKCRAWVYMKQNEVNRENKSHEKIH